LKEKLQCVAGTLGMSAKSAGGEQSEGANDQEDNSPRHVAYPHHPDNRLACHKRDCWAADCRALMRDRQSPFCRPSPMGRFALEISYGGRSDISRLFFRSA